VRRTRTLVVFSCSIILALSGRISSQQPDFETLFASAQQAQARGDFQAAAEFYRKAAAIHPDIAEVKANLGLMYYQIGNDEQAIEAFAQAIRLKPELFAPNLFLGRAYVKQKRFIEAIPYLKKASLSKPDDIHAQLSLAQAYAGLGKMRLAIDAYLHAAQIDPRDADIWYHLGVSYLEQVEADARVLVARHKESPYFQVLVGDNFSEQHALIQAAEAYQKALASPQFPAGTHASYGFVLLSRHDLGGAEQEFNAELRSSPGSLMAKLGLARRHLEQGATEEAAKEIEAIWISDAGFLRTNTALFNAGLPQPDRAALQRVLEEGGERGGASAELLTLFRPGVANGDLASMGTAVNPENPLSSTEARLTKAAVYAKYAGGEYRECRNLLSPHLQELSASELRMLAFCAYSTGDYQPAYAAAAKLSITPGTEAEGLYWETKSAQRLATEALARASVMDSNSHTLHVLLGDIYRQRRDYPDAEQEYRKALAIRPEDTGAQMGLSLTLLADSEIEDALHVAESALINKADDPELNAVMAEILCARNDFARAEPYLKKSLNTKPEYVPHVHALLGKVYARTGHTKQAIAELKLALTDDKDGTVHYQIGRLYLKVGDRVSAKQAFEVSKRLRSEGLNRANVAMQQGEDDSESQ
jgi:tetratricopeptide (TPR) repeat protein